jgi:hypothetical protein
MRPSLATLGLSAALLGACGDSAPPPPPDQPVAFSHKVHAKDNELGCTMCHAYAERSTVAGIPSIARCRGCHRFVAKDKPEVQKILKAFDEGKPIEWNRVHRLPDHVYFAHERHVRGGVRCQECHGDVASMDLARQVSPLTMGWCVDCHRARGADTGCVTCHK